MSVTKTSAQILAAAQTVGAVLNSVNQSDAGCLKDASAVFEKVRQRYAAESNAAVLKTFADATSANIAALWTALSIVDGDVFYVVDADDTTDNALQAAKGSAVAANDVFQREVNDTCTYVGVKGSIASFDAAFAVAVD